MSSANSNTSVAKLAKQFARRQAVFSQLEALEPRQMYSATATPDIDYSNFKSISGLALNGYGKHATTTNGGALTLTTLTLGKQARSAWSTADVGVDQFTTHFTYTVNSLVNQSGFTFTLQNGDTSALGTSGNGLGYAGIGHSVALEFSDGISGSSAPSFAVATDGSAPAKISLLNALDIRIGDKIAVAATYDGTKLNVTIKDGSSKKVFSSSMVIDIPTILGSSNVIAGFTAGSGLSVANQRINSWDFTGNSAPWMVNDAVSAAATVYSKTADLSALADDDDGADNLTYTWSTVDLPGGAKQPTFSDNGTNSAKNSTARFYKAGKYTFMVTVTDQNGMSVTDLCHVNVAQTPTELKVTPHAQIVNPGDTLQYAADELDQFGRDMRVQPTQAFAVMQGDATIDPITGFFTAGETPGHVVVQVTSSDGLTGVAGATIIPST